MRAGDLIGREVHWADGTRVGIVTDLRCVQDGPQRGTIKTLRISALAVSRNHTGSLLGYNRSEQRGPWLIRVLVERLHRQARLVAWAAVDSVSVDGVTLRRSWSSSWTSHQTAAGSPVSPACSNRFRAQTRRHPMTDARTDRPGDLHGEGFAVTAAVRQAKTSSGSSIDAGVARELSELARELQAQNDPQAVMQRIVDAAASEIDADRCRGHLGARR